MGFAGTETGMRIIVDTVNGIAYFAGRADTVGLVTEVRYLPMSDPLVVAASLCPLTQHGVWLVRAARSTPRYKNLLGNAEGSPTEALADGNLFRREVLRLPGSN